MDVLDQALEHANEEVKNAAEREEEMKDDHDTITVNTTGEEDSQTLSNTDPSLQYQFPDGDSVSVGSVTYRVVSVTQSNAEPTATVTNAANQQITQVIQAPFNADDGSAGDGQSGETRFTYFPASAMATDTNGTVTNTDTQAIQPSASAGGQFYVMMSPQDVLQGVSQRTIAPRSHQYTPKMETVRTARDDRRRATHNEVERRRRDKINNWIVKLSKLVPDCEVDQTKQGQSKGGILMKTCDYINDLKQTNTQMATRLKETERHAVDLGILQQQFKDLQNENAILRAQLSSSGIEVASNINS